MYVVRFVVFMYQLCFIQLFFVLLFLHFAVFQTCHTLKNMFVEFVCLNLFTGQATSVIFLSKYNVFYLERIICVLQMYMPLFLLCGSCCLLYFCIELVNVLLPNVLIYFICVYFILLGNGQP